mgnify:CR=1 FL=1
MARWKPRMSGLLLTIAVALASLGLAPLIPGLNAVMLAIILGVFIYNIVAIPASFSPGISFSSSKVLEWAIIFMAFSISLQDLKSLGWFNLSLVVLIILIILLVTLGLSRMMSCPSKTGWMVGFGTAICGSSAIAALAPSLDDREGGTGIAIAAINLIGAGGMVLLPFLFQWMPLSETQMGFIIGSSLHSVGNVAGAGYGLENDVGDLAITVKMARVALLSPAVIFFLFLIGRKDTPGASSKGARFELPYYLWAFIGITLLNALWPLHQNIISLFQSLGTVLLTIAMAGIGLKISFKHLYRSGRHAIGFGFVLFAIHLLIIAGLALTFI